MNSNWDALSQEVAAWRSQGRSVDFWWRDDDAHAATPELSRMLELARSSAVPLALAVIPQGLQSAAFDTMAPNVQILQHGADHVNRAGDRQKKTEFPDSEPVESTMARLLVGARRLRQVFGERALPVLVPPWNRFPAERVAHLARAGYRGLSTFQPRQTISPAPGLRQVNTHVDIVDWHAGRGFIGEQRALEAARAQLRARRLGQCDAGEPLGWLTHHAVHDESAWNFLARLFEHCDATPGLRWKRAGDLFLAPRQPA